VLQEDWLARVASINQWSRDGVRAPHKPLLLLYAIGRLTTTGSSRIGFVEAEQPLKNLLTRYGPPGVGETPHYPFRRLENDGLWTVELAGEGPDPGDSQVVELRKRATGEFPSRFESALKDPLQRAAVIHFILDQHFPPSLHDDLLADVGLEAGVIAALPEIRTGPVRLARDPKFREAVLMAYERACGFCGFDGQVGTSAIGIEAAHIRWHAMGGPDKIANGIALCTLHHKLFDQGAVGLTTDHRIMVSQHFVGRSDVARDLVLSLVDSPLRGPQTGQPSPSPEHLGWHHNQVFRSPARKAG